MDLKKINDVINKLFVSKDFVSFIEEIITFDQEEQIHTIHVIKSKEYSMYRHVIDFIYTNKYNEKFDIATVINNVLRMQDMPYIPIDLIFPKPKYIYPQIPFDYSQDEELRKNLNRIYENIKNQEPVDIEFLFKLTAMNAMRIILDLRKILNGEEIKKIFHMIFKIDREFITKTIKDIQIENPWVYPGKELPIIE